MTTETQQSGSVGKHGLSSPRDIVTERQHGYCVVCGCSLSGNDALHHRKLRKHGGQDTLSNFLLLHHKCHNLGTHSVHLNPSRSYANGWLVPSWAEPDEWPLVLPDGSKVLLTNEGTVQQIQE